jgi:hypothetical protein
MLRVEAAPIDPARIVGFDTIVKLTRADVTRLASTGLSFACRYVGLGAPGAADLDAGEVRDITDAGLGVMPVQYARTARWNASTGQADGESAARRTIAIGLPPEVTVWCDLEGRIPLDAVIEYAAGWYEGATNAGVRDPGLYVGAGVPLTSAQLFHDLPFRRYWRSLSQVPNVDVRGYQLLQLFPDDLTISGVRVDLDVVQSDYQQTRPVWAIRGA